MPIAIKSKREGFRRCGIPHSIEERIYPDERFTPEELTRLQNEPMLTVRIIKEMPAGDPEQANPEQGEGVSVPQQKRGGKKR